MKIGIYEQIINQIFEEKISSIDQNQFYVGERVIKKDEVDRSLGQDELECLNWLQADRGVLELIQNDRSNEYQDFKTNP